MVAPVSLPFTAHALFLLADDEPAQPLLWRLPPESRAMVLMALLGLVLTGLLLIAIVYLGGRYLKRIAGKSHGPSQSTDDDWQRKPLVPPTPPPDDEPV